MNKITLQELQEWIANMNYGGMVKQMAVQLVDSMQENELLKTELKRYENSPHS